MILKKRQPDSGDKVNTDRYLITYADLITLLLGLFVILYASSQVDEEKYKELSNAFSRYFKSADRKPAEDGSKGFPDAQKAGNALVSLAPAVARKSTEQIKSEVQKSLDKFLNSNILNIRQNGSDLVITLPEKLMFSPGKAEISQEGLNVLDSLAAILRGVDNKQVAVDGHTDSETTKNFRYESNWHLSTARALNIGYTLIRKGVPENYMVIRGYGSQRPVADNSTDDGKAKNRRVEITISELPADAPSNAGYGKTDSTTNFGK